MALDLMELPGETGDGAVAAGSLLSFRESLALPGASAAIASSGHSIYEKRLTAQPPVPGYDLEPHTVYFYYVRLDTDGRLTVRHYSRVSEAAIPHASLQQVIQEMVDNVRSGDNVWPSDGSNFANIVWTRKSYIAFFIDEANWDLNKAGSPYGGVRFAASPTPNHSFYDAVDLKATVVSSRTGAVSQRSAIAFVNHMKRNAQGDDLEAGDRQAFKFEMIFDVKFADLSTAPLIVIFDPDGTNLGPPVPPP